MSLSRTLTALFTCSAAALLAGCGGPATPATGLAGTSQDDGPGIATDIRAVTRINDMDFREFTTAADPDITCFSLVTRYGGTDGPNGLYCTAGAPEGTVSAKAKFQYAATVQGTNIYRVEPATRPDLRCYISGSRYSGSSDGVGSITCLPKAQARQPL